MMNKRLYSMSPAFFDEHIKPLIEAGYSRAGHARELISDYQVFCALLYVLRTSIPWRDLPKCCGHWHCIYQRFNRGSDRGV